MPAFRTTDQFRRAVQAAGLTQTALAQRGGLAGSFFNRVLHGDRFGDLTRQRIILIGQSLGLAEDQCVAFDADPVPERAL